jgi:hypothetical protein
MSDFLKNLASRSLNLMPLVQPRLASRFEPLPFTGGFASTSPFEVQAAEDEADDDGQAMAAQSPARTPTARVIESPPVASSSQLPDGLREEKDGIAGQADHVPSQTSSSRQPHVPILAQPVKTERQPVSSPSTEASQADLAQTAAGGTDKPQTNRPEARNAFESDSESRLESRIRRALAEQLNGREAQEPPRVFPLAESPLAAQAERRETPESAPIIRVTIGRIDVRAINAPAPQEARRAAPRPAPQLSLEDYLRQRSGGRR